VLLGRHLYYQIAIPLVLAALIVGGVATVVATYFLSELTDRWIEEVAESASAGIQARLEDRVRMMESLAGLTASDAGLTAAIEAGDVPAIEAALERAQRVYRFTTVAVVDTGGQIVAAAGEDTPECGRVPLTADAISASAGRQAKVVVGSDGLLRLVVGQPTSGSRTVCVSTLLDEEFVAGLASGSGNAYAFVFTALGTTAISGSLDPERLLDTSVVSTALESQRDAILELVSAIEEGGAEHALGTITVGEHPHTVRVDRLPVSVQAEGAESDAYVLSLISHQVTAEARSTTVNFIVMWSVVAVLALVGLGGWVARRVSIPLESLTEGARRVADGDFSTQIEVRGANEIGQLAKSFNQMTESLEERSGTLTKKLLELATLYEMSRSLGSTLDMDELLESVLGSALRIFGADLGYVTMRETEGGAIKIRAHRGLAGVRVDDQTVRSSMSEWVIAESRPLIFNPSDSVGGGQVEVVTGALAALCVPLVSAEGAVGAIMVGSQDPEQRFDSEDVRLLSTIANHVTIAIGNIELFSSLQEAYLATVRSLAAAVDAKDPFTRGHSEGVAIYAGLIGQRLGLSHDQLVALEMAAYLHDIGKIGIKEEILLKPGTLTDAEMGQMRHHPLIGANILKPVGFPWPITPVVRHHHEYWDGNGYPAGLRGEEIPLLARILAVADAYEAMISDRPYRDGRSRPEAIAELRRCAGAQFDPDVVEALIEELDSHEHLDHPEASVQTEDIGIDEAHAVFVALSEGMLGSFRILGGPRLADNVEKELNERFAEAGQAIRITGGRVAVKRAQGHAIAEEIEGLRTAVRAIEEVMGRTSGHALVDHFCADSMAVLPERMRSLAERLRFYAS